MELQDLKVRADLDTRRRGRRRQSDRVPIHLIKVEIKTSDGVTYVGATRNGMDAVDLTGIQFDMSVHGFYRVEMPVDKLPGATSEGDGGGQRDLERGLSVELRR